MDIAHGELVEAELDAFIERRSRQKDPDEADAGYMENWRRPHWLASSRHATPQGGEGASYERL